MQSGDLIYEREHIKVSRTLFEVGTANYAIASISSFRIVVMPPKKSALHWVLTFAGFFLFMGLLFLFSSDARTGSVFLLPVGIILAICAVLIRRKMKPSFGLCITTTAQEQQVITSQYIETLMPIESALQQAISMRH